MESESPDVTEQVLFELPDFEGLKPIGVITKVSGAGQRITRPLGLEQRVILVVEAVVSGVDHKTTNDGVKRIHTLAVKDLYEAEGKEGKKLLSTMRQHAKKVEDERSGRLTVPGVDTTPKTDHGQVLDNNGVALTPEEVAAARGEEVTDLTQGEDPIALIFSDNSRALWPDDYLNSGFSEPFAGDFLPNPNNEDKNAQLQIIKVLDVETGEEIESWGDEEEAARLKAAEDEALAQEKAKPKLKAKKVKGPKVIVDEITGSDEEGAPALPGDDE